MMLRFQGYSDGMERSEFVQALKDFLSLAAYGQGTAESVPAPRYQSFKSNRGPSELTTAVPER